MSKKIVAFLGPISAGKTTAAKRMKYSGSVYLPFAAVLKDMLITMGLSYEEVWGVDKETPSALLGGKTPRYAMQTLGTEWGRNLLTPDVWVNAWRRKYEQLPTDVDVVLVDDLRFPNEYETVKNLGGATVKIINPQVAEKTATHESEAYDFTYDYLLYNGMDKNFDVAVRRLRVEILNTKQ